MEEILLGNGNEQWVMALLTRPRTMAYTQGAPQKEKKEKLRRNG